MQGFNIKNIKNVSFKQTNNTIAARFGISTKNNAVALLTTPGEITAVSGLQREVVPIVGFTNGIGNGRVIQTTGNFGYVFDVTLRFSYGDYIAYRNQILKVLTSRRSFTLQAYTMQQNQTVPILIGGNKNYFTGFADNVKFTDSFNGKTFANGDDTISFRFYAVPEVQKPKKKRSIFATLDKAVSFLDKVQTKINYGTLDKVQTNINYGTLALRGVNTALIEVAKSISSYGSGVASFIQEMNQLQNSVSTLIKSPTLLAQSYASSIKSFKGIFSSGDTAIQKQYYSTLKGLVEYNKDILLNTTSTRQSDGSYLNVFSNIEKNIILGKTTTFTRATALLTLCNMYENYNFENAPHALEVWSNINGLFNFFANEARFDGLESSANISSKFTNNIFTPDALEAVRDYVFQTLEVIREYIFNSEDYVTQEIIEPSNVYEIVAKRYGSLDKLEEFMLVNKITSYSEIIQGSTQVKFS